MRRFAFKLEGVLKVRKAKEQQKLGDLAKVMQKVNVFREQEQAFDEQYNSLLSSEREKFKSESIPIARLKDMYDYLGALRLRKDTAILRISELQGEVNQKRTAYNAARKDRRVVEILREKKWNEYKMDVAKEEIHFMDEFNQSRKSL